MVGTEFLSNVTVRLSFFSRVMDVPLLKAGRKRGGTVASRSLSWKARIMFLLSFSATGYHRRCCNRIPVQKEGGGMALDIVRTAAALSHQSCGMFVRITGENRGIFGPRLMSRKMISPLQPICIREYHNCGRQLKMLRWGLLPFNLNAGKRIFSPSIERNGTSAISFVEREMRTQAIKLHTKSQAPAEGQAPAKEVTKKFTKWSRKRKDYLQVGQTVDWLV